ncbi:MAG: ATP synthase F0 subunit C [Propionibacteriaceae bacterium]|jgi:F-type H+-transporting ATPase subunit c|nr:ATP synthase F0 subunit C [Propionibacteriaceae bacterium]
MLLLEISAGASKLYGYAAIGIAVAFGVAWIFTSVITSTARQPEAHGKMQGTAMIGAVIVEALAILGFVLAFVL